LGVVKKLISSHSTSGVLLAHHFVDVPYNRTGIYLASKCPKLLCSAALKVCREAYSLLDSSLHKGSHPSLGVVDHCCISPLLGVCSPSYSSISRTEEVREKARELGVEFGRSINNQEEVDVYFYGAASSEGVTLKSIRKRLNYFDAGDKRRPSSSLTTTLTSPPLMLPDLVGEGKFREAKGLMCVGVVPTVIVNYNIRMTLASSCDKSMVSDITSRLRVPSKVEALTLHWGDQLEIACNLLSPFAEYGPDAILAKASVLAAERGLTIETSYATGPSESELLDKLCDEIS
jgi:glutamate formiminotransferase